MPFSIRSDAVNRLAERLAAWTNTTTTDAVKVALEHELQHLDGAVPDKEFYDELSGDL
jgi:hypothetical protein